MRRVVGRRWAIKDANLVVVEWKYGDPEGVEGRSLPLSLSWSSYWLSHDFNFSLKK